MSRLCSELLAPLIDVFFGGGEGAHAGELMNNIKPLQQFDVDKLRFVAICGGHTCSVNFALMGGCKGFVLVGFCKIACELWSARMM
eukprot:1334549-Amphidinium_carterae.1